MYIFIRLSLTTLGIDTHRLIEAPTYHSSSALTCCLSNAKYDIAVPPSLKPQGTTQWPLLTENRPVN